MTDAPYTQLRQLQWRGPSNSSDYNARIEENYHDLVVLYNRARLVEEDLNEFFRRLAKEQLSIAVALETLEARVDTLEGDSNRITFHSTTQIENDRFEGTLFEVPVTSRCTYDPNYGLLVLPRVATSSLSKLYYTNNANEDLIPSTLETRVVPDNSSAESGATIDSSDPVLAILRRPGRIWERNVIVGAPDPDGVTMTMYLKVPTELYTTENSNALVIHPFPALGVELVEVAYTTDTDVMMQESDGYDPLNVDSLHVGNPTAVGWMPPGAWEGDTIVDCGPRTFYFPPKPITGIRLTLRQKNAYKENGVYIYSYGLAQLDLRYEKFLATGKTIIRFDAPEGQTISSIDHVQPEVWNVAESELAGDPLSVVDQPAFSYRVIWETSADSGVYTETSVPNSSRVWLEVTLNEMNQKGTPALSGLTVEYS